MAKNFCHGMGRSHEILFKSKYTQVILKSIFELPSEKLRNNNMGFFRMYFVSHSMSDRFYFVFLCSKGELSRKYIKVSAWYCVAFILTLWLRHVQPPQQRVHVKLILIFNIQEILLFNLCFLISGQFKKLLFKDIAIKFLIGRRETKTKRTGG